MFDNVVIGVDDHQAGRDALELATELVSADGTLMLVHVQMLAFAGPPDADPHRAWQLAERGRALERLAALRSRVGRPRRGRVTARRRQSASDSCRAERDSDTQSE
jgi:hypothetical protein